MAECEKINTAQNDAEVEELQQQGVDYEQALDMLKIAKLVYETSKKYGGIYINSACCKDSEMSWVTFDYKGRLLDVIYRIV